MSNPQDNLVAGSKYRARTRDSASFLFATGARGGTGYRLNPDLHDPASASGYRLKVTPHAMRLMSVTSLVQALAIGLVGLFGLTAIVIYNATVGNLGVLLAVVLPIIPIVFVFIGLRGVIDHVRENRGEANVLLEHDAVSRRLVLHGTPIDAKSIEAVERIVFAVGAEAQLTVKGKAREHGGDFTRRVHVVLRERLQSPDLHCPSATRPGVRYRVVACTSFGLRRISRRIARRLDVPFSECNLGTFVHDLGKVETSRGWAAKQTATHATNDRDAARPRRNVG
jgi:hypothetical protein